MAAKSVIVKGFQQRHDTAANWRSKNPILLAGEAGIEIDTLKIKVGNGETTWNSLAYANVQDLSGYLLASAAASTYATKAETKEQLDVKANASEVYTKTEVNQLLQLLQTQVMSAIVNISVSNNKLIWEKSDGTRDSFTLGDIKWG